MRAVFVSSARPEVLLAVIERAQAAARSRFVSTATDKGDAVESAAAEEDEPSIDEGASNCAE